MFVQSGGTLVRRRRLRRRRPRRTCWRGLLRRVVARDDLVLAGRSLLGDGPHGDGAGRGALLGGLDRLLRRLGTDHLDLWQLPGWDPDVPLDETLAAAEAAVMSGRVRYVGLVGPRGLAAGLGGRAGPSRWPGRAAGVRAGRVLAAGPRRRGRAAAGGGAPRRGLLAWAPLGRGVLTGRRDGTDDRAASTSPRTCRSAAPSARRGSCRPC